MKHKPLEGVGDILVLAGDVGYLGDDNYSKHPFWDWVSANYKHVYAVPGNHELYKFFDINALHDGWQLDMSNNLECVSTHLRQPSMQRSGVLGTQMLQQ